MCSSRDSIGRLTNITYNRNVQLPLDHGLLLQPDQPSQERDGLDSELVVQRLVRTDFEAEVDDIHDVREDETDLGFEELVENIHSFSGLKKNVMYSYP